MEPERLHGGSTDLTFSSTIRSHHFLSSAIFIPVNSAVSDFAFILKQLVPSLPLLSTPDMTTVTLNLPKSQIIRQINRRQIRNCLVPLHVLGLQLLNVQPPN